MSLPLTAYHSLEHYVSDLERAERYYTQALGFKRIGQSKPEASDRDGMQQWLVRLSCTPAAPGALTDLSTQYALPCG